MRTKNELNAVKDFIDSTYNSFGNRLNVNTDKPLDLKNPEYGYCYKDIVEYDGRELYYYNIVCSKTGITRSDFRIMMHEYGHIYLGHLDGIHVLLDSQICNVFRDNRGELIDRINKECGIDFADKLIERVIDDPVVNHSLHNIAMDMEVNTKILSNDDVEEMESDISKIIVNYQKSILEKAKIKETDESAKKYIDDAIAKMKGEAMIKLILPCRYHLSKNVPFPDELSYPEYLMMIVEHLDQFVKMLVNISKGGNGDTSDVSSEDVKNALDNMGGGMKGLDSLMKQAGMSDEKGQLTDGDSDGEGGTVDEGDAAADPNTGKKGSAQKEDNPYDGQRDDPTLNGDKDQKGGTHKDHLNPDRKEADEKRKEGLIRTSGGLGCGKSGGPDVTREVEKTEDEVDTAIDEVIMNLKNKIIKREMRKDVMWNYNRGINRKVIAPSIKSKVTISTDPKLVFLIDISGSMNTRLIDRILNTISKKMRTLGTGRGLKYDIISWSTYLGEHIKDIDPRKGVPRISSGGGTEMSGGMEYFKEHYDKSATLILISDFEDTLSDWHKVELTMPEYTMYGFNYGLRNYNQTFTHFKVRNFNNSSYGEY